MDKRARPAARKHRYDARKGTQQERLVSAIVELASSEGYEGISISQIVAVAGVSRPTFYEYFHDKSECLRAAVEQIQQHVLAEALDRLGETGPENALSTTLGTLVEFASSSPAMARVLMSEAMAGGPRVLYVRDQGIGAIASGVEAAYKDASGGSIAPDASAEMAIGGVYRLLARRLRRGEQPSDELTHQLGYWIDAYSRELQRHRWRALAPYPPPEATPSASPPLLRPVGPARTRSSQADDQLAEDRQRILFAAAEIAQQSGYAAASASKISERAGLDHRAFRRAFADREEVIFALHELFFQHMMTVSAGAFFAQASWPERVWQAGVAFTQAAEQDPLLAKVGFVQAHEAGGSAVKHYEDLVSAFKIFLEQGYELVPTETSRLSDESLEAIVWMTLELAYARSRASGKPQLRSLLPHVTFWTLAPFLGTEAADHFIDQKLDQPEPR
ncbi:MAG TPA: TetR/AcrR family transcriptional regulator [Solirubrobacteraceae bacterium]|nr:TetR/AcrR family transcriptional regulator [Solirubrobacteraceae bacterium]